MAARTVTRTPGRMKVSIACCGPIQESSLDDASAALLATVFAALADPARLKLLNLIATDSQSFVAPVVPDLTYGARSGATFET